MIEVSESPGQASRDEAVARRLRTAYDSALEITIRVDRHKVKVAVEEEPAREGVHSFTTPKIKFTTLGADARDAVLAKLAAIADDLAVASRAAPRFYICRQWGGFTYRDDLAPRPLDTVVLADGVLDHIVGDLTRFLAHEQQYSTMGMPWHRGYLFKGPPGTGKSSAAIALAQAHGLNVYYMPLSDLASNGSLFDSLRELQPRSVLLLEDIDVVRAASERVEGQAESVTLDGLLNALDGAATPHGLVTIMTTNKPERLDEALIRAGRIDVHAEFGRANGDHVLRLLDRFCTGWEAFGGYMHARSNVGLKFDRDPVAPSSILEAIKSNLDTPELTLDTVLGIAAESDA